MKALSLWQPWASMMAIVNPETGKPYKTIETRSWSTSYRGPLVICSALRRPDDGYGDHRWQVPRRLPGETVHRVMVAADTSRTFHPLPLGCGLVVVNLVDVIPIVGAGDPIRLALPYVAWWTGAERGTPDASLHVWEEDEAVENITDQDPYGDFSPGRFAWITEDARPFPVPVPCKGRQGLWTWPGA